MLKTEDACCESNSGRNSGDLDLIVVGAGSAGFSAAITAAEQGARVALVGHGTIGGTCVNVGCVPSKTMIRAAETMHHAKAAERFNGIRAAARLENWSEVISQKDDLVATLRQAKYADLLPQYEAISYHEGRAQVMSDGVQVNGSVLRADKVIVTTGARSSVPPIEGIQNVPYLTSTSALDLKELPESLIVIGGGVIGCELGQMFSRMGAKVTLLCRSHLLPGVEPEISSALEGYLKDEGIDVICGAVYKTIKQENGVCLCFDWQGETHHLSADHVLLATGRSPNTRDMGLEELGVELARNGDIIVDEHLETSVAGVYAAGDVTGRDQFVYMAAYGAKLAAQNALNGNDLRYDNSAMPAVVFTDPNVAMVGLTEAAAREQGINVNTSTAPLDYVPRALAARDTRGLIKLVADAETGKLLGAHVLAPEGADTIQTAAVAIKTGLTVQELGEMIYPYLTTVEGLKLAAQTFDKDIAKLSCCAG